LTNYSLFEIGFFPVVRAILMETFSLSQVICRPILERDLREIKEFCKTIWDGHDYVPNVIDEWFQDPRGIFAVAEYEGHAIACSKVTWLAEGQWWLEGFRVDPQYQGLKVGSLIHRYVDQWWLEHGSGMLRLMTSSKNVCSSPLRTYKLY
jgi:GNAT superfamily N-acetyltransferase